MLVGVAFAQAEETPPDALTDAALEEVEGVLAEAERHLVALNELIANQDERLDDLYDRRDAAEAAGEDARVAQLDGLIDRLTLTLDNLEVERARIVDFTQGLGGQVASLRALAQEEPEQ